MEIEGGTSPAEFSISDLLSRGDSFWSGGDSEKALACYIQAITLAPQSRAVVEKLAGFSTIRTAALRSAEGDLEGTVAAYRSYLHLNPSKVQISCELGLSLFQLGRTEEAISLIVKSVDQMQSLKSVIVSRLRLILRHSLSDPEKARFRFFALELLSRQLPWLAAEFLEEANSVIQNSQAVCVVGMHRSGTSMLANVVRSIGVDFGPERRLFAGNQDNPDGFFENRDIVQINDDLLAFYGGAWDAPPEFPAGWESSKDIEHLRNRAALLIAAMASSKEVSWGWKDPRTCFTLPFWRHFLPDLKVVVIIRDPGSVATSLQRRGGYSTQAFGLRLWKRHYDELLASFPTSGGLVVRYDRFCEHTEYELNRISAYLGCEISSEGIESVRQIVKAKLRHHKPDDAWCGTSAGRQVVPVFERLMALSEDKPISSFE